METLKVVIHFKSGKELKTSLNYEVLNGVYTAFRNGDNFTIKTDSPKAVINGKEIEYIVEDSENE